MALEDPSFLLSKSVGLVLSLQISSEKVPYNTTECNILSVLSCDAGHLTDFLSTGSN